MCIYIYIYIIYIRLEPKDSSLPNYPCKVDPDSSLYRAPKNAKKPPGNEKNMGIFSGGCYILGLDIFPNFINQLCKTV